MKPRATLFQNGSIGDFLMAVYLSQMLWKSGRFSRIEIVVPRNADFLRGFIGSYSYLSVLELSSGRPGGVFHLLRGKKVAIVHPTVGRIPLRVKFLAWLATRGQGSDLLGFSDAGPACGLYAKRLTYDTTKPYIETVRDIARALSVPVDELAPKLECLDVPGTLLKFDLAEKPYIVFHPGASNPKRMFNTGDAVAIVEYIRSMRPDFSVVLSGGPKERVWLEEIKNAVALKGADKILLAAELPAPALATLIKHSQLFIGTDTGATHLACFFGVRVLCVAHHGTANWLPFYAPTARVLYRLKEDTEVHDSEAYMHAQLKGRLKPFGKVSVQDTTDAISDIIRRL